MPRHYGCVRGYIYPDKDYSGIDGERKPSAYGYRYCRRCKRYKPAEQFTGMKNGGYYKTCTDCREKVRNSKLKRGFVGIL